MAKGAYIGVSGVARNITQPYIGTGGVSRAITNGYIGVDGVARQFYSASPITGVYSSYDYITLKTSSYGYGDGIFFDANNGTQVYGYYIRIYGDFSGKTIGYSVYADCNDSWNVKLYKSDGDYDYVRSKKKDVYVSETINCADYEDISYFYIYLPATPSAKPTLQFYSFTVDGVEYYDQLVEMFTDFYA